MNYVPNAELSLPVPSHHLSWHVAIKIKSHPQSSQNEAHAANEKLNTPSYALIHRCGSPFLHGIHL